MAFTDFQPAYITNFCCCKNILYFSDADGQVYEWTLDLNIKDHPKSVQKIDSDKAIKKLNFDLDVQEGFSITVADEKLFITGGKMDGLKHNPDRIDEESFERKENRDRTMIMGSEKSASSTGQELVKDVLCYNPETGHISDVAILTRALFNHFSLSVIRGKEEVLSNSFRGGFDQLPDDKIMSLGRSGGNSYTSTTHNSNMDLGGSNYENKSGNYGSLERNSYTNIGNSFMTPMNTGF